MCRTLRLALRGAEARSRTLGSFVYLCLMIFQFMSLNHASSHASASIWIEYRDNHVHCWCFLDPFDEARSPPDMHEIQPSSAATPPILPMSSGQCIVRQTRVCRTKRGPELRSPEQKRVTMVIFATPLAVSLHDREFCAQEHHSRLSLCLQSGAYMSVAVGSALMKIRLLTGACRSLALDPKPHPCRSSSHAIRLLRSQRPKRRPHATLFREHGRRSAPG